MSAKRGKILIVDDEDIVRRLLHRTLSKEGYRCWEAANAEQAQQRLESNPMELVILDILMPDKSGAELLPEIKASYPDTAVIMATAIDDSRIAIECMKQGAYDYLTKPFDQDEVILSVGRALEKERLELANRDYQEHLEEKVEEQAREIRQGFLGAMQSLVLALEAKNGYTAGHSQRVCEIAMAIGKEMALSDDQLEALRWGSLLHDIGKIAVEQSVVDKPTNLTAAAYEHVMTHTTVGATIVRPAVRNKRITEIIEHHHAYYDGSALGQKLRGKDIPLLGRIVAVAHAYDAMTSSRSYRAALPAERAQEEIRQGAGTQFDPDVVNAFLKIAVTNIVKKGEKVNV